MFEQVLIRILISVITNLTSPPAVHPRYALQVLGAVEPREDVCPSGRIRVARKTFPQAFGLANDIRDEGGWCAGSNSCVYCVGNSGRACCRGTTTYNPPPAPNNPPPAPPPNNPPAPVPESPTAPAPTTVQQTIQQTIQETIQTTISDRVTVTRTAAITTTLAPVTQFFTTTYIYTYITYTLLVIQQPTPTVTSTTTTVTTIFSVTATDREAAGIAFRGLATSISSSARSSAEEASRTLAAAARNTQLFNGGGSSSGGNAVRSHWAFAVVLGMLTSMILLI